MSVPLQIVFQGGGAKLPLLMAVCQVIKEYEDNNLITVTRAAGASAGAVAAAMLACETSISEFRKNVKLAATKFSTARNIAQWRGMTRCIFGGSYFGSSFRLKELFAEIFDPSSAERAIGAFDLPLNLYFTDMYSLSARVAPKDELLSQALEKSCNFPFAFVGYSERAPAVDGGLAVNLPVDELYSEREQFGPVIAISFTPRPIDQQSGMRGFVEQLVSAAIQSGVNRSQAILGAANVFSIETEIGTFDFERALGAGMSSEFDLTVLRFKTWFNEWLKANTNAVPPAPEVVAPNLSEVKMPAAVIRELASGPVGKTLGKIVHCHEIANFGSDGKFDGTYLSCSRMTFAVLHPVNLMHFEFQTARDSTFDSTALKCWGVDTDGAPLDFTSHVEDITCEGDELKTYRLYFFFNKELTPDGLGQPYLLGHEARVANPYTKLGQQRPDVASFFRGPAPAEEMTFVVALPREVATNEPILTDISQISAERLARAGCKLADRDTVAQSASISYQACCQLVGTPLPPKLYHVFGRRAKNVQPWQGFGVLME